MDEQHLAEIAGRYQAAHEALEQVRIELTEAVKEAYAEGKGLRKSEIGRAINHVWSREWLDRILGRTSR